MNKVRVPSSQARSFATAVGRWARLGPYYAMFPVDFAFDVVETYCPAGSGVLDPFAGRASSIFAAAALGRYGRGIEIHPVPWLYARAKLAPAPREDVLARIDEIDDLARSKTDQSIDSLPPFFTACFCPTVLRYLLTARQVLMWRTDQIDATLMALVLTYLHGKRDSSLSNQMRQSKSMSPEYSVRWWTEKNLSPPPLEPSTFLKKRVEWRYARGIPTLADTEVKLGDSTALLGAIKDTVQHGDQDAFGLMFTSPPYYAVTNYHYDQWLRLWMLGGPDRPIAQEGDWRNRFESRAAYRSLLCQVFTDAAGCLDDSASVYVRTDARAFTYKTTLEVLTDIFPNKGLRVIPRPLNRKSQTALFGDKSSKPGDIDIILRGSPRRRVYYIRIVSKPKTAKPYRKQSAETVTTTTSTLCRTER